MPGRNEHSLEWWELRSRHSAWAELGRLDDSNLIVAVALQIAADSPAKTKEARETIRDFRRANPELVRKRKPKAP